MEYATVIVAAGVGRRMNLGYNKVFYELSPKERVIDRSLQLFLSDPNCKEVVLVLNEQDFKADFDKLCGRLIRVRGGATRAESVYNGLMAVGCDHVLIHDGARPFVSRDAVNRLLSAMEEHNACILAIPEKETVKEVQENKVVQTIDRAKLWHAQTPQGFQTDLIIRCVKEALKSNITVTDDAQAVELFSEEPVMIVPGEESNIKLTVPADLREKAS